MHSVLEFLEMDVMLCCNVTSRASSKLIQVDVTNVASRASRN